MAVKSYFYLLTPKCYKKSYSLFLLSQTLDIKILTKKWVSSMGLNYDRSPPISVCFPKGIACLTKHNI
jgi:hypothetical protein